MPLPIAAASAAAAAAYSAAAGSLSSGAAQVIGFTALSFAIIGSHDPNRLETATFKVNAEAAAECVARNAASTDARLVASVQPLHGTRVMAVIVKSGSDPLLNVVISDAGAGSQAEMRPVGPPAQLPEALARIIDGC